MFRRKVIPKIVVSTVFQNSKKPLNNEYITPENMGKRGNITHNTTPDIPISICRKALSVRCEFTTDSLKTQAIQNDRLPTQNGRQGIPASQPTILGRLACWNP